MKHDQARLEVDRRSVLLLGATATVALLGESAFATAGDANAIGVLFEYPGVTAAQYDGVINKLTGGRGLNALSDWPVKGIVFHVAGPTANGWRALDVWESEAAFGEFGGLLIPLLQEFKFPSVEPQIFRIHNIVKN